MIMTRAKKPQHFNINKRVGQANQTRDLKGRLVERQEYVFIQLGENIIFAKTVYDPDHFLYQNTIPITEDEVKIKYGGILPLELRGASVLCTCGAEGVYMLEGPYANLMLCKSVAMLGKHQTSFEIKDNVLHLDKKTADERLMGDSDIAKTMETSDEKYERTKHWSDDDEQN